MLFLDVNCSVAEPILRLVKFGLIPLIQGGIIIVLIILLIIDIGKAVIAGKEDEMKSAQKLAIKRAIYALVIFFIPWIVNTVFGILDTAGKDVDTGHAHTWLGCYNDLKK